MNLYVRNWVVAPLLWAVGSLFFAWMLGLVVGWKLTGLLMFTSMWGDFLDGVLEGRPLSGPRRWKK